MYKYLYLYFWSLCFLKKYETRSEPLANTITVEEIYQKNRRAFSEPAIITQCVCLILFFLFICEEMHLHSFCVIEEDAGESVQPSVKAGL